ncbi:MAG: hypothetical protein JXQ99_16320 [Hyphomicrobiaceae bacterium]
MRLIATIIFCALMAGCSSSAKNIAPSYVSPIIYQDYDCSQLAQEAQRVTSAAQRAAGIQDEKANNDAVATGVAVVLFWPAAFMVSGGDGQTAAELAKLRGQKEAIEQAAIQKKCGISFEPRKKTTPS